MKTVTLYRPNTLQNLMGRSALSDINRYFNSFFGDSALAPATRMFTYAPAIDIRETKTAYLLEMDLPGYSEQDIEISIDGDNLSIASKKEAVKEENDTAKNQENDKDTNGNSETWLIKERQLSSFSRSFRLPDDASRDEISAEFKNGVLSMELKKRPETQKRAIQINVK